MNRMVRMVMLMGLWMPVASGADTESTKVGDWYINRAVTSELLKERIYYSAMSQPALSFYAYEGDDYVLTLSMAVTPINRYKDGKRLCAVSFTANESPLGERAVTGLTIIAQHGIQAKWYKEGKTKAVRSKYSTDRFYPMDENKFLFLKPHSGIIKYMVEYDKVELTYVIASGNKITSTISLRGAEKAIWQACPNLNLKKD